METHTKEESDELVSLQMLVWTAEDGTEYAETGDWNEERAGEFEALTSLADKAEDCALDWRYGEVLISDSYFEKYAREFAEDIGAIKNCDKWPATCIDWEEAADELKQDYTSVDFGGETYWIR